MPEDTARPDLRPTAAAVKELVLAVRDEQLADPTPCEDMPVARLLDHLMGLTLVFRMAAEKVEDERTGSAPDSSAAHLDPEWQDVLPSRLDDMAKAWRDPQAWEGKAEAGGVTMPAEMLGVVALNELVIHGWDLAAASGLAFQPDDAALQVSLGMVSQNDGSGPPGLFMAPVPVPDDAPLLDRVIGASGRDPQWAPAP